jgi:hypothetical protein
MRRLIPTPALLVACLALVVCLGGVGYAAARIGTKDLRPGAVTSAKIRNGTIAPADLGAATVAALRVRAYGNVTVTGDVPALDPARSTGFSSVTRPRTGVYCLRLADRALDPATTAPVVGVDWDNSSGANLAAYLSKSAHQCPRGSDLGVRTFSFTAGSPNKPSDTVAFTIVVP